VNIINFGTARQYVDGGSVATFSSGAGYIDGSFTYNKTIVEINNAGTVQSVKWNQSTQGPVNLVLLDPLNLYDNPPTITIPAGNRLQYLITSTGSAGPVTVQTGVPGF
jgi:hypothetical protein